MCFPSKRQKNLLSDDDTQSKKKPAPEAIKAQEPAAAQPSTAPSDPPPTTEPAPTAEPSVTTTATAEMSSPKVAIIIYSMYGHIAKCTSERDASPSRFAYRL